MTSGDKMGARGALCLCALSGGHCLCHLSVLSGLRRCQLGGPTGHASSWGALGNLPWAARSISVVLMGEVPLSHVGWAQGAFSEPVLTTDECGVAFLGFSLRPFGDGFHTCGLGPLCPNSITSLLLPLGLGSFCERAG